MKHRKQFDAGTEARRRARESAPAIPAKRVIPDKRTDICSCNRPELLCPLHDDDFTDEELALLDQEGKCTVIVFSKLR